MAGYMISSSSELMENYIQSDFLSPQKKFQALQTTSGCSLLFSIGTNGVFNLTIESVGVTHGWRQINLGKTQIQKDFSVPAAVTDFAAAQLVSTTNSGDIHLAMIVNDGTNDHLYLSLTNSSQDLGWVDNPAWVAAPFNAVLGDDTALQPPSPFRISNVFLSEASDKEWIVVDILRTPDQTDGPITRYFIDMSNPQQPKWTLHDLAVDVQASNYDSCLGRSDKGYGIDGLYTKGSIGASAQLVYTPLVNAFDPGMPPLPARLVLPGGLVADAIAAVRNSDQTSDLYVAAYGQLFLFAHDNQRDQSEGVPVATNGILSGVKSLYAYAADEIITVWGLNANDEVFYLTCPVGQSTQPGSWKVPLPIMSGADSISPFVNRTYNANTFFAHSGDGLLKMVKSPTTGLWSRRSITLPPIAKTQTSTPISSYTTHISVSDANGKPAPNVSVSLSATNVTSVLIDHLYYVVGPYPIELTTNALGTLTIVEIVTSLAGTRFQASIANAPAVHINTMDSAWQRNAQYTTTDVLKSAQIVSRDGQTRPFLPATVQDSELKKVADSNAALGKAYTNLATKPVSNQLASIPIQRAIASTHVLKAANLGQSLLSDLGDVLSWLESGIEAAIDIVEDVANGVLLFVAKIGDAIYHGVVDCVEAVVAAATWVYNAVKVAIEDLIKFLEFLFGWHDILVTHSVLKKTFLTWTQSAVSELGTTKSNIVQIFQQFRSKIDSWADVPQIDQSPSSASASDPPLGGSNSAPANLGVHHLQGSAGLSGSSISPTNPAEEILNDLIKMMEKEGEVLSETVERIKTDVIDQFDNLSITDVIKRLLAIMADTILQTAENVLTTFLDIVAQLVAGIVDLITAKVDIPVLSWLYKDLTGEDLSFLDLICLVAAIPVTLIYKIAADKTPFRKGDALTDDLLAASSMNDIKAAFVKPAISRKSLSNGGIRARVILAEDAQVLDQDKLKIFAFVTGIASLFGSFALIITTNYQRVSLDQTKTLAGLICVSNICYVSPNIATIVNLETGDWSAQLNNALTTISILKGVVAIRLTQNEKAGTVLAFVESLINVIWNAPVIANIVDNYDIYKTSYKSLPEESIGNFAFNMGGILEYKISTAMMPEDRWALMYLQAALMVSYGAMMVTAGGIYEFAADQHH